MSSRLRLSLVLTSLLGCASTPGAQPVAPTPSQAMVALEWADWSPAAFEQAASENRLILINVVASWCHWCHVMDEKTYAKPEVAHLLETHFVIIRVDSDARPDIAERYQAWGWPATAILSPQAESVTNLRGYQASEDFAALLTELVQEHERGELRERATPTLAAGPSSGDLDRIRAKTEQQLDGYFDEAGLGWGKNQKYPWSGPIEYAFLRARLDPAQASWRERALATLEAAQALIDPVWGGMYQYSLKGRWDRPHFEKIASIQAGALENYSHAAMITGDGVWLAAAARIADYLLERMQDPDGGFHTSQDADLRTKSETLEGLRYYALDEAERLALGTPRVDTAVYASLNGPLIHGLTELYRASADPRVLAAAERAATRILTTHRSTAGGLSHGPNPGDDELLYLADQAGMAWGLLGLYRVTGERRWRDEAEALATFMVDSLSDGDGGLFAHTQDPAATGVFSERRKPLIDNALAAQVFIELDMLLDGDGSVQSPWLERARLALLAVGGEAQVKAEGKIVGRYLYALTLLDATKFDFSIVAAPEDPAAAALHRAAVELWEPRASVEFSTPGKRYPDIGKAALYLCSDKACSRPLDDPGAVAQSAERFFVDQG